MYANMADAHKQHLLVLFATDRPGYPGYKIPKKANDLAAGFDFYAPYGFQIAAQGKQTTS